MTKELEPCPFCGGDAIILYPSNEDHFGYLHSVACCTTEGCRGEQFDTWYGSDEEAIEAWNTRYKRTCKLKTPDKVCSECGAANRKVGVEFNFCPNCGAEVSDGDSLWSSSVMPLLL